MKYNTIFPKRFILGAIVSAAFLTATAESTYNNPVINQSAPDPTVIRADDGTYYLYATENVRHSLYR